MSVGKPSQTVNMGGELQVASFCTQRLIIPKHSYVWIEEGFVFLNLSAADVCVCGGGKYGYDFANFP